MSTANDADWSRSRERLVQVSEKDLEALLHDVGRGDRAALKHLYEAYSPRLFAILCRLVASQVLAEDVLRDVFIAVWQEAWRFDATKCVASAWLIALTRRQCIVALKAESVLARSDRVSF